MRSKADLRVVGREPPTRARLLRELIVEHDKAEAIVKRARELIRQAGREWADEKPDGINPRQFTRPSLEQLRREFKITQPEESTHGDRA